LPVSWLAPFSQDFDIYAIKNAKDPQSEDSFIGDLQMGEQRRKSSKKKSESMKNSNSDKKSRLEKDRTHTLKKQIPKKDEIQDMPNQK